MALDAQLLAQLYVELMGGRQIGLVLDRAAPEQGAIPSIGPVRSVVIRPARPHGASPAELARHGAFVATFDDPLWPAAAAG